MNSPQQASKTQNSIKNFASHPQFLKKTMNRRGGTRTHEATDA